ncbi:Methyltransferase-like protein 6 [Clydaea vesicula]|uniref:tRNA N(3)-methylcytidine methyltransferase n=1 Tax=Clydaea vesicula TaxID=447962 RepID=A0AAD5XXC8_9FUNG|nr:Methyltransferase-like protein 6 [Clydaea vesicula]
MQTSLSSHPLLDSNGSVPEEVLNKISTDEKLKPSGFQVQKLKNETRRNWDLFYKRNTTNFYKDRHWLGVEFEELLPSTNLHTQKKVILELGCGVGNFLFPQLQRDENCLIHACDLSERAIEFIKKNDKFDESRCNPFVCDITTDEILNEIEFNSVDIITSIFCLSAIDPTLHNYGYLDEAQLRFKKSNKIEDNFYFRQDGTFSYYFDLSYINNLFKSNDQEVWEELELNYVLKKCSNKKQGKNFDRIFTQAKFRKAFKI